MKRHIHQCSATKHPSQFHSVFEGGPIFISHNSSGKTPVITPHSIA